MRARVVILTKLPGHMPIKTRLHGLLGRAGAEEFYLDCLARTIVTATKKANFIQSRVRVIACSYLREVLKLRNVCSSKHPFDVKPRNGGAEFRPPVWSPRRGGYFESSTIS